MKISTKGRYAIRLMIDLAEHNNGEFITLMDIAQRQEISEKYLESIVSVLSKNNFLISLRGKGGGYKLAKDPELYTVGSILRLTEGSLAPVSCLEGETNNCNRAGQCQTLEMWEGLNKLINDYFDGITIADLIQKNDYMNNYVI
ncbi:Rrf2 family transcriptional regulator [Lacrimispora amygdalina]|uniref:Rrf2 family transcriptional regulator n=1 Tax=Lacrimispora amygdalina TaxID=253257 RepID=A0A3E2N4K9_9FIRM|nr:Rrf2 family transcriptional regulator [Clostridium indicum]RFZ75923.1 Rrf2 family transcriptional regulator [Clostridium indicum]